MFLLLVNLCKIREIVILNHLEFNLAEGKMKGINHKDSAVIAGTGEVPEKHGVSQVPNVQPNVQIDTMETDTSRKQGEKLTQPHSATQVTHKFPYAAPENDVKKWSSSRSANQHVQKHFGEFIGTSVKNREDYKKRAIAFFQNPPPGTLVKETDSKKKIFYNPLTNWFGVISPGNEVLTLFKPNPQIHGMKDNMEYFANGSF